MKKILIKTILIIAYTLFLSCGYKVLDNAKTNNFNIKEIKTYGDKRINFKIKNNLMTNFSETNKQDLIIELTTKKKKSVKEKNIKNEISKYEISLVSKVKLTIIENDVKKEFNTSTNGSYAVNERYFNTLKNEKRLIDNLTDDLSKKITKKINQALNDF